MQKLTRTSFNLYKHKRTFSLSATRFLQKDHDYKDLYKDLDIVYDPDRPDVRATAAAAAQVSQPGHVKERWTEENRVFEDLYGTKTSNIGSHADIITLVQQPVEIDPHVLRFRHKVKRARILRLDQSYNNTALDKLGPDLLCAHFLVPRACKVKFENDDYWYKTEGNGYSLLPLENSNERIEAVDASNSSLMYEGFDYFRGLKCIRYLNLNNSYHVDDFCLEKISLHLPSLELLDLSNCESVTERGLATLHTLKNLKRLRLNNTPNVMHKQLICLLLEEKIDNLFIEGVDYSKETIDKEIEEDRKLYESRYNLRAYKDIPTDYLTNKSKLNWFMENYLLKWLPKSSETGFLSRFFPTETRHRNELKDGL